MMKTKILNFCLIITSLAGYLEWGKENKQFLFQSEFEIISKLFRDPNSLLHPFILLPLFGQIILAVTLFQSKPGKILSYIGLGSLGVLLLFMFLIGVLAGNYRILISTIPFIITGILVILHHRKKNNTL